MTRAEERALEVYPRSEKYTTTQRLIINDLRDGFIQGYEQAEKDLGWISVFDRLPAPSEWVVVCIEYYGRAQCLALATYNYETKEWHTADFEDGEEETVYVEYWMPIPNIIKEAKK